MEHFICTGGCKGVADHPKVCDDASCTGQGHELLPCNCKDGKHYGRQEKEGSDKDSATS